MTRAFRWTLAVSTLTFITSIVLFGYNQHFFNLKETIDAERFSFFGTFISGLAGLLTIWLLYWTYQQTRETHRVTLDNSIDTTFFNLIQTYRSIVTQLHARAESTELKAIYNKHIQELGKSTTEKIVKDFFEMLYGMLDIKYKGKDNLRDESKLMQFFKDHDWMVGHYFRSLIYFIKWVTENNDINNEKKTFYMGFIKSQLTFDELRLFYYYVAKNDVLIFGILMNYNFFDRAKDLLIYPTDWDEFLKIRK